MSSRSKPGHRGAQLHIVTGKGGTGKTTLAGALALAVACTGKRVLLCEVEGRQGIAALFDVAALSYQEHPVAVTPHGGEVFALAIDAEAALKEYLEMYYRLGRAGRALDRFGVVDFATTIAPGLRDVLLTGKVYEAARRRRLDGGPAYEAIVLDAPPTGRIARFLNVNAEVAGLARVGPIRAQADAIMALLRSPRTSVHLVTVLEEMPVQETLDAITELRRADLPVGRVLVNLVRSSPLARADRAGPGMGQLDVGAVEELLHKSGVDATPQLAEKLLAEGFDHVERLELQADQRAVLARTKRPVTELPFLADGIDLGALHDLAETLTASGLT